VKEKQARTAANVVMFAAAAGAAFVVLRNPRLRRLVWQLARQYAAGPAALWGAELVRESWQESGRSRPA
jgi:flagellar biosynthesis component FlhA